MVQLIESGCFVSHRVCFHTWLTREHRGSEHFGACYRLFCCYRKSVDTLFFGARRLLRVLFGGFEIPWEAMTR